MLTGYTVIKKWECEWSFEKQYNNDVLLMCRELNMTISTLSKSVSPVANDRRVIWASFG